MDIYLAGGLFNAGERLHNLFLEKHLLLLGHRVILPQREALRFFHDGSFDIKGIVRDCQEKSMRKENLYVGSTDGADADSGTSVEFGMAIVSTGRAIVYRTDFRTLLEKEIGVNAMFSPPGAVLVYLPCFYTSLEEVDNYYENLARMINEEILKLINPT